MVKKYIAEGVAICMEVSAVITGLSANAQVAKGFGAPLALAGAIVMGLATFGKSLENVTK